MSARRQTSAPLLTAILLAACTSAAPPADDRVVADEAARATQAREGGAATTATVSQPLEAAPAPAPVDAPPIEPAPPCPAAVADAPTALFDDTVLIRPPVGVELVEMTPALARSLAPTTSACDRVVTHMLVGLVEDEPARALVDLRDQIAAATDLPAEALTWTETREQANRLEGAYAVRATAGGAPARGWFVISRMHGVAAWVQIEAAVADFDALAPTLKDSGERLLIVPRG